MSITKSSGNVFQDLGFSAYESAALRARAELMNALIELISDSGMTQTQVAEILGVRQPRVSDLMRGRLSALKLDSLIEWAEALGLHVEIKVSASKAA